MLWGQVCVLKGFLVGRKGHRKASIPKQDTPSNPTSLPKAANKLGVQKLEKQVCMKAHS